MPATVGRPQVAAAIAARIPRAVAREQMLVALDARVPAFARVPPQSRHDVRAGLDRTLRRWTRFMSTGTMPGDEDFAPLRDWARQRANEGVLLEHLLQAFGVLHQAGWRLLREHAEPEEAGELVELAELLASYLARVSVIVAETYMAERDLLVSEEERRARSLLDALVAGEAAGDGDRELAETFGLDVGERLAPFAAVLPGGQAHRHAALAARLRRRGVALAVTENDVVVGLSRAPLTVKDLEERSVLLAVDEPADRDALPAAREEVVLLLTHARRHRRQGRVAVEDWLLEVILDRSPRLAGRLRERVLAPLRAADQSGELQRTLRVLFASRLDRGRTSAALHIHRNTLAYRLAKIEKAASLDLESPHDLALVESALRSAGETVADLP